MNLAAWAERNGVAWVTRIVVEHRDRFCRLGSEYVRTALLAHGRELVVVDSAEVGDDLLRDMTEIIASPVCKVVRKSGCGQPRQACGGRRHHR